MHFSEHVEVNSFLQKLDSTYRMPILQVRKILLNAHPEIYESIARNNLIFSIKTEELFVVKVVKNSVRLIFLNGAFLEDKDHILMSFGLKSRCLELYEANAEVFNILPKYIEQSVKILNKASAL